MISVKTRFVLITSLLLLLPGSLTGAANYHISAESLSVHVRVLASDSLAGREVGEPGEFKSAKYISSVFEAAGLIPYGEAASFRQPFEFTKKILVTENNLLTINNISLTPRIDYVPLKMSASKSFEIKTIIDAGYGITVKDSSYDDYAGLDVAGSGVLVRRFAPDQEAFPKTDFDPYESLSAKVANAISHEATAIFFVTPEDHEDSMSARGFAHVTPKDIPVIWLRRTGLKKLGLSLDGRVQFSASGVTELVPVRDTGYNVVGLLPGLSDTSILIGGHHDHLGWGTETSLYRGEEKLIHYGADDNGSGTAAMLELARQFASRSTKSRYSMIFAAFSGEERGLLGSSHMAKNEVEDPRKIRAMFNLDMIGRLADQESGLAILGTGTCVEFKEYFDSLPDQGIKLAFKEAGIGPSDHTSFYNLEIPVLFFFTGAHIDYHKPSDTWDKLDYEGLVNVAGIVSEVTRFVDEYRGPLTFQKVKDSSQDKSRSRSKVKLGIMPDYAAEVKGLKIDAVMPDQAGEKAGILAGDILIQIGDAVVEDIYGYMDAMKRLRPGDTVNILVARAIDSTTVDTLSLEVVFE